MEYMEFDPVNRVYRTPYTEVSEKEVIARQMENAEKRLQTRNSIEIRRYGSVNEIMDDWIERGWLRIPYK